MQDLEQLLYLTGVGSDYLDYGGVSRQFDHATRTRALTVRGYSLDASKVVQKVYELDAQRWRQRLRSQYILSEPATEINVHCHPDDLRKPLAWAITTEQGQRIEGKIIAQLCAEVGEYWLDDVRYTARTIPVGVDLPTGYHSLWLSCGERDETAQVIVTPAQCFDAPTTSGRLWGITCQLYTLVTERNWGIGDFGDLQRLIELAAPLGADIIGINPLHAPRFDSGDFSSPYYASDRRFLNVLYIDPDAVASLFPQGRERLSELGVEAERLALVSLDTVDYQRVARLKYRAYGTLYQAFLKNEGDPVLAADFKQFVVAGGAQLQQFAEFETHHNPFAGEHSGAVDFHQFLQWLASRQYLACQGLAIEQGMAIGILGDLAVGAAPGGCEAATNPDLFVADASIGAPPDPFSDSGQDWGLPPPDPVFMRNSGYADFISLLRANMHSCGGLRIDHVMALTRLWWCLAEDAEHKRAGVYVHYSLADLLALVRLESQRHRCVVVGEDMGVVPAELRDEMASSRIFGNDLLYFDKHADGQLRTQRRAEAVLMVTNHDVPPLKDWWQGTDIQRRRKFGLIGDDNAATAQRDERERDKHAMLVWLAGEELLQPSSVGELEMDMALCAAIHRGCARSASLMLLLQLEDLQLMDKPVNVPGTSSEYPNWRRKQAHSLDSIFARPEVMQLLQKIDADRHA